MADLLAALAVVLESAEAQALSLESTTDRAALLKLVAAEVAAPAPLTVGEALRTTHVVEFIDEDDRWRQHRQGGYSRTWRATTSPPRWSIWGWPYETTSNEDARPCRRVPIAEAEASPETRGPLPAAPTEKP